MTNCGCTGGKKIYHEFFVFKLSGPLEETLGWHGSFTVLISWCNESRITAGSGDYNE